MPWARPRTLHPMGVSVNATNGSTDICLVGWRTTDTCFVQSYKFSGWLRLVLVKCLVVLVSTAKTYTDTKVNTRKEEHISDIRIYLPAPKFHHPMAYGSCVLFDTVNMLPRQTTLIIAPPWVRRHRLWPFQVELSAGHGYSKRFAAGGGEIDHGSFMQVFYIFVFIYILYKFCAQRLSR